MWRITCRETEILYWKFNVLCSENDVRSLVVWLCEQMTGQIAAVFQIGILSSYDRTQIGRYIKRGRGFDVFAFFFSRYWQAGWPSSDDDCHKQFSQNQFLSEQKIFLNSGLKWCSLFAPPTISILMKESFIKVVPRCNLTLYFTNLTNVDEV